jgi:hypothetical protein
MNTHLCHTRAMLRRISSRRSSDTASRICGSFSTSAWAMRMVKALRSTTESKDTLTSSCAAGMAGTAGSAHCRPAAEQLCQHISKHAVSQQAHTMMMTGMQPCSVASSMRALQPWPGTTMQKMEEASSSE